MENSLKAILIGAGVVITLIVVSIGFILMRSGQSTAKNAISKLDQMNVEMSESEFTMYDGMEVRGSEVVNLLNKYKGKNIGIQVKTKRDTTGKWYIKNVSISGGVGTIDSTSSNSISNAMKETNPEYVNPNGVFMGSLVRDANGTIVALTFEQQ